jgi:diguanylate cyclase (GGDEF)-like protein
MPSDDEARNLAPRNRSFWAYLGLVTALGLGLTGSVLLHLRAADLDLVGAAFYVAAGLLVLLELRPLVTAGSPDANGVSTSTVFVFALLLHWGLGAALLMMTIATILADVVRRKAPWRTAFNVGQFAVSYACAWAALAVLGLHPSPASPVSVAAGQLFPILVAGLVYFLVNNGLVSQALALRNGSSFRTEFYDNFGYQVASTGALIGLAPIVVVVMERSAALVPLLLLPLAAVYATASLSLERERQALHDTLTGLPNRKLLVQRAREALAQAKTSDTRVALFLLDLDRFKEINDTLGHHVGDALLTLVGRRLAKVVGTDVTVARLGGDEFAILVSGFTDDQDPIDIAQQIRGALAQPFRAEGMSFEIDGSLGIALHPQHGLDVESLLQRADVAMYVAKDRNTGVEVYTPEDDRHSTMRLGLLAELRGALSDRQLELHYQPKADLRTGDIVGVEALIRWCHPERGMVPPDDFIPLAEQTALMRHITQFVVDEALAQLALWWRSGLRVQVAVNVCARDLYDRDFSDFLRERLDHYGVPPRALMVEVTESVLMADPARAASTLLSLAAVGVGVSLDDFGTGYSSLVHLKRLPVSEVKIDRSFIMRMDVNEDDAAIVRSIIDLASVLGLRVVAEGVETRESWERLAVYGCDAAQGWFLSKAKPADEVTDWLRSYRGVAVTPPRGAVPAQEGPGDHERRSALA